MSEFMDDFDRPPVNPYDDLNGNLETIIGQLRDIQRQDAPLTETDIGQMKSALDTVAHHSPGIAAALGSIKIAAWIIAIASVLHLFR